MWEQNLEIGSGDVEEEINLMNFLVRFSMLEKFFCSVFPRVKKSTKFNFSSQNHSLECFSKWHEKVTLIFPSKVLNCRFFHLIHSRKKNTKLLLNYVLPIEIFS